MIMPMGFHQPEGGVDQRGLEISKDQKAEAQNPGEPAAASRFVWSNLVHATVSVVNPQQQVKRGVG
jgi:hypothetical protein